MDNLSIQQPGFIFASDDGEYVIHYAPLPSGDWVCEARKVIWLFSDKVVDVKKLGIATRPSQSEAIKAGQALVEADKDAPIDWSEYTLEATHPLLVAFNEIWTAVTGENNTWSYPAAVARETLKLITDLRVENNSLKMAQRAIQNIEPGPAADDHDVEW